MRRQDCNVIKVCEYVIYIYIICTSFVILTTDVFTIRLIKQYFSIGTCTLSSLVESTRYYFLLLTTIIFYLKLDNPHNTSKEVFTNNKNKKTQEEEEETHYAIKL